MNLKRILHYKDCICLHLVCDCCINVDRRLKTMLATPIKRGLNLKYKACPQQLIAENTFRNTKD